MYDHYIPMIVPLLVVDDQMVPPYNLWTTFQSDGKYQQLLLTV